MLVSASAGPKASRLPRNNSCVIEGRLSRDEGHIQPRVPALARCKSCFIEETQTGLLDYGLDVAQPLMPMAPPAPRGPLRSDNSSAKQVRVNVYEIEAFEGLNQFTASGPFAIGGAMHVGVEVYGREWCYGGGSMRSGIGVICEVPRSNRQHRFRETVFLGETSLTDSEVALVIGELLESWLAKDYHWLHKNCLHFANELCEHLGVGRIPAWIDRFARGAGALDIGVRGLADAAEGAREAVRALVVGSIGNSGEEVCDDELHNSNMAVDESSVVSDQPLENSPSRNAVSEEIEVEKLEEELTPPVAPAPRQPWTGTSASTERESCSPRLEGPRAPPPSEVDAMSRRASPTASPLMSGRPLRPGKVATMLSPGARTSLTIPLSRHASDRTFKVRGPVLGGAPLEPCSASQLKFAPTAETTTRISRPPPVVASWQWQNRQNSPSNDRPTSRAVLLSRPASERSLMTLAIAPMSADGASVTPLATSNMHARRDGESPVRCLSRGASASHLTVSSDQLLSTQSRQLQGSLRVGFPSRDAKTGSAPRLRARSPSVDRIGISRGSSPTISTAAKPLVGATSSYVPSPVCLGMTSPVRGGSLSLTPCIDRKASQSALEPRLELSVKMVVNAQPLSDASFVPPSRSATPTRQVTPACILVRPPSECSLSVSVGQMASASDASFAATSTMVTVSTAASSTAASTATSRTPTPARQSSCTWSTRQAIAPVRSSARRGDTACSTPIRPTSPIRSSSVSMRPPQASCTGSHTPQLTGAKMSVSPRDTLKPHEPKQSVQKGPSRIRAVSPAVERTSGSAEAAKVLAVSPAARKNVNARDAPTALRLCPTPSRARRGTPSTWRGGGRML